MYGGVPPLAPSVWDGNSSPVTPEGRGDRVVKVRGAGLMVRVAMTVATPPELSAACTVKAAGPGAAGIPAMVPEALSDNPAGTAPPVTDHM